jgi:hypothetical protein
MIRMVSRWADSEHEQFVRNATQLKAIWMCHGAEDFRIARMMAASHAHGRMVSRNILVEIDL